MLLPDACLGQAFLIQSRRSLHRSHFSPGSHAVIIATDNEGNDNIQNEGNDTSMC
jgi:hypothetical protein